MLCLHKYYQEDVYCLLAHPLDIGFIERQDF